MSRDDSPDMSPAAHAAFEAFEACYDEIEETTDTWDQITRKCLAAALFRLARHQCKAWTPDSGTTLDHWNPDEKTRQELRNLAMELGNC